MALEIGAEYVTVPEAARILGVSQSTIWRWIDRGDLPAVRVGRRHVRIRRGDLPNVVRPARPGAFTLPPFTEEQRAQRVAAGERLEKLRDELFAKYGPMGDSVEIIREGREERTRQLDNL